MRRHVNLVALAISSMVVLAFTVPLGLQIRQQTFDRALSVAQREAQSIATAFAVGASSNADADEIRLLASSVINSFGGNAEVTIFLPDGTTEGAGAVTNDNVRRAQSGAAFTAELDQGAEVLVPIAFSEGQAVVRAFVPSAELERGVRPAWALLALLGLALVTVSLWVADRLGRSVTAPVLDVAEATRRVGAGERSVRAPVEGPPEVQEVAAAFNDLADRLDDLLKAERESVADLSHRLRTPLTALRLQAEALDDAEAVAALMPEIEGLERAVTRLIEDARAPNPGAAAGRCDVRALLTHRLRFWKILAREQNRPLHIDVPDELTLVALSGDELGAALDVLFENFFAHTPAGTSLYVKLTSAPFEVTLRFEDNGPGFSQLRTLTRGMSGSGSTGLGLDIVRRVAEKVGGQIRVANRPGGGAVIEMRLPAATPVPEPISPDPAK